VRRRKGKKGGIKRHPIGVGYLMFADGKIREQFKGEEVGGGSELGQQCVKGQERDHTTGKITNLGSSLDGLESPMGKESKAFPQGKGYIGY